MTNSLQRIISIPLLRKLGFVSLLSLPVVIFIFKISMINRHGIFRGEDWDYFAQSYEAARQSIVHYHQFPWWNSWMNGGQPLFANPQFGLFSIQMPLVLLFGTVAGLHYSLMGYFLLGFWGMYLLCQRTGSRSRLISSLLAYLFVFSSFNAWHLAGGHLTFAVYLLAPWALLTVLNIHKKRGWLWFGLVASLLLNTAAHYLTIEALVVCGLIAVFQISRQIRTRHIRTLKTLWQILLPYALAGLTIVLLSGFRLFYTLQFAQDYPRLEPLDPAVSVRLLTAALTFRHAADPGSLTAQGITHYGWIEYANYFGLLTLALYSYLVIRRFEKIKSVTAKEWTLLGATALALLTTLGAFSSLSPFSLLHQLPVFNQMRVPSRFICWFALGVILFLVRLPKKPVVYILLFLSVLDVFAVSYPILNYSQEKYNKTASYSSQFQQYEFYETNPEIGQMNIIMLQNYRLLRATQENYGEIYGYEPILDIAEYYYLPGPSTCGVNKGCDFVLTRNAKVTHWSPQNIALRRTGPGEIKLNMNPGSVWYVNNKAAFPDFRILELQKSFTINDPSENLVISFRP